MKMQYCTHFYTGDGKGKTTAALGLALRFIGAGGPVLLLQFMKGAPSAELFPLATLGVDIKRLSKDYGLFPRTEDRAAIQKEHDAMLQSARTFQRNGGLLLLDECISAYNLQLLDCNLLESILQEKSCEIVCTGRNVPERLLPYADYITDMKAVRHPFTKGLGARRGIEF